MNRIVVLSLVIFSLFTGCKKNVNSRAPSDSQNFNGVIRIGEVGSMTGSDATFGTSTHEGILLAASEANQNGGIRGKKIEVVSLDDKGSPAEAVLAMTRLIHQDQVSAILGEVASSLSLAMAPIAQQYKVPMISPSSINGRLTQQGNYVFRICYVDSFQSKVMSDFAIQTLHAKTAAILRDSKSDYSRDSAKIFTEHFTKAGGKILIDQVYSAGDIDFKSQLTAIRAVHPDVILVPGYYTEVGLIARQSKELGLTAPLLGGDGWDSPKLREIGGEALDGSYFVSHFDASSSSTQVQGFLKNYKSSYGRQPDGLAALGYDSMLLLLDALKREPNSNPSALRDSLAQTKNLSGVTGKISIGPDRNAIKSGYVFKFAAGGHTELTSTIHP